MKKILSILLAAMLLMCSFGAVAETPDGYPEVRIDPATGKPYDLEGQTVYVYDYWSGSSDWHVMIPETEEEQAQYDYRLWIEKTYNCKVIQQQKGDWGTCAEELIEFASAPDGTLCTFIVEPGKYGSVMTGGVAANWNNSNSVDMTDSKWNQAVLEYAGYNGNVYGVSSGASQPRQCLFFNKRLLEEAGIDWNTIYDMQLDGTWTWEAFEELLKKTSGDNDNDGYADSYGLLGSADDLYKMSVFSNGGSFFDYNENGELEVTVGNEQSMAGLEWAQGIWADYAMQMPDGANWDWYKQAWNNGEAAFYMYQAYGGFNDNSEMSDMEDEWGCVAFPTGPEGEGYVSIISENMAIIPNVYNQEELDQVTLIYDLWTSPTPGYENSDSWIGNKYNYTDERAVEETFAMLRDPANGVVDYTTHLGSSNDILGSSLLWSMQYGSVQDLVEAGTPAWQAHCDKYNAQMEKDNSINLYGYETLTLPGDLVTIEAAALAATGAQVIIVPDSCTAIGANAFRDCDELLYVVVPASVQSIGKDAFTGCNKLEKVLVEAGSQAAQYCQDNEISAGLISDIVYEAALTEQEIAE